MPFAYDLTGTLLDRRYRIIGLLGKGGMGHVYNAEHIGLQQRVAIKVLHPRFAHEERFRERFIREARSASRIKHRNVVRISDFGDTPDGSVYFAMEFLEGHDIGAELKRSGAIPWPRVRHILRQVIGALGAAHAKSIIHRDIKPANCFLTEDKDEGLVDIVKVLDFGIAKVGSDSHKDAQGKGLTGTGEVFGTATYMSPEQACGNKLDARSDMYSLGVMAYEMLTGKVPFIGINSIHVITRHLQDPPPPLRDIEPSIPAEVEALVLRTLAKKREERFESMKALQHALKEIPASTKGKVPGRRTLVWDKASSPVEPPPKDRPRSKPAPNKPAPNNPPGAPAAKANAAEVGHTAVVSSPASSSRGAGVNKRSVVREPVRGPARDPAAPRRRPPLSSESVPTARTQRPSGRSGGSSSTESRTTTRTPRPPSRGASPRPAKPPRPPPLSDPARPPPPRAIRSGGPPAAGALRPRGGQGISNGVPAAVVPQGSGPRPVGTSESSGALPPPLLPPGGAGPPRSRRTIPSGLDPNIVPGRVDPSTPPPAPSPGRVDPSTPPPGRVAPSTPPPGRVDPSTPPPGRVNPSTPPPGHVDLSTRPPSRANPSTPPPGHVDLSTRPPSRANPSNPPPGHIDPSTPLSGRVEPSNAALSPWNAASTGPHAAASRGDSSAETSPHMLEPVAPSSVFTRRVLGVAGLLVVLVGGGSAVGTMMILSTNDDPPPSGVAGEELGPGGLAGDEGAGGAASLDRVTENSASPAANPTAMNGHAVHDPSGRAPADAAPDGLPGDHPELGEPSEPSEQRDPESRDGTPQSAADPAARGDDGALVIDDEPTDTSSVNLADGDADAPERDPSDEVPPTDEPPSSAQSETPAAAATPSEPTADPASSDVPATGSAGSSTATPPSSPAPAPTAPSAPTKSSSTPARPMYETTTCAKTREEAQAATTSRQWRKITKATGKRHCWPPEQQEDRLYLKVWALLELGEFAKCAKAGRKAKRAQTKSMAASCKTALARERE